MKVLAIIQARLGSSRLPNKVLLQIPPESGVSMLEMVVRKALLAQTVDDVVVVTPDRLISLLCNRWNIAAYMPTWEGRDVLREYWEAAQHQNMHLETDAAIVRITADCPLLQAEEIDRIVREYKSQKNAWLGNCAFVYNTDESTGQLNGEGSDIEVFSFDALKMAHNNAKGDEREHVTTWMRKHLRTQMIQPKALGLKSVNTYQDYLDVCEIIREKRLAISEKADRIV